MKDARQYDRKHTTIQDICLLNKQP